MRINLLLDGEQVININQTNLYFVAFTDKLKFYCVCITLKIKMKEFNQFEIYLHKKYNGTYMVVGSTEQSRKSLTTGKLFASF